jgi:tetratricopeptide (TPR) repeat protein
MRRFAMNRVGGAATIALFAALPAASSFSAGERAAPDAASLPGAICVSGVPSGVAPPQNLADWAQKARLFDGLGDFHRPATTSSPEAQKYFDQGMRYLWAFNHDEATRSFAKAAELDPNCAACYWGAALTVGPNYNLPVMIAPRAKVAWEALQLARQHAKNASPVEQALIAALGERYRDARPLDPGNEGPILAAYAAAMKKVAEAYPDDDDVQVMYAEAMMNINAWKLWSLDGKPAPGTEEIVAVLEHVLSRDPRHPGANHYYIHAVEASPRPEKAVASAERLPGMMPFAGHLEHMPAHIMQRVGRYAEAAEANRKGLAADLEYFAETRPLDYYLMYTAHNYHFLAFSTAMEGRRAETIEAGRKSLTLVPDEMLLAAPGIDWYAGEIYQAMIRFGLWDEILTEPAPDSRLLGLTVAYRYARTAALAAKDKLAEAKAELATLESLAVSIPTDHGAGLNRLRDVYAVASLNAAARIALAERRTAEAIDLLQKAVGKEDGLAYAEPADWFFPTRHLLGAVLLGAGRAAEAEAVYRDDLRRHPGNGWALFGLSHALTTQGKSAEAAYVKQAFDHAWAGADTPLTASAF